MKGVIDMMKIICLVLTSTLINKIERGREECVSENITNLSIYFKDVHMLEEDWNRADGSILYATALFQKYLTLYEACKTASDIEKFEEIVQKNLDNCKNKSTSAKCIWADMGMRISIWTKKDYTKFWDTLIEESDQANSLALRAWLLSSSEKYEKGEELVKRAADLGEEYAIGEIGKWHFLGRKAGGKAISTNKQMAYPYLIKAAEKKCIMKSWSQEIFTKMKSCLGLQRGIMKSGGMSIFIGI